MTNNLIYLERIIGSKDPTKKIIEEGFALFIGNNLTAPIETGNSIFPLIKNKTIL